MARQDRHQLVNLTLIRKLVASSGLVLGLALFLFGTLAEIFATDWYISPMNVADWGGTLAGVWRRDKMLFAMLFGAHAASLVIVLVIAHRLFRRVAIPRGARAAVSGLVIGLGAVDLFCWTFLASSLLARSLLGYVVALESLVLASLSGWLLRDMWMYKRWRNRHNRPVRVAIVGGGFAGLYAAIGLDRILGYHKDVQITVVDRRNYFLFPPLLPSVAAGAIETRQVTYPFRRIFEATNIVFRKELVERIDLQRQVIHSQVDVDAHPQTQEITVVHGETPYDYLVLCPGSDTNLFNTPGAKEHAFYMRELGDAVAVRNQVIDAFERAARESQEGRRREHLTFVIVGAGPTGVELASEVHDLVEHILLERYPEIDPAEVSVYLVQSGKQILPGWHDAIVTRATSQLSRLNIKLLLNRRVVAIDSFSVTLDGGQIIRTRTCVWCAGVRPSPLLAACGFAKHPSGRVEIDEDLRVKGMPNAFVLGDAAFLLHNGKPLPPLGQVAFQQGSHAAENLGRLIRGKPVKPFRYKNFGALVSVGEHFAAIELLGIRLSGFSAWMIWRTLYLTKLVGFSNKLRVVIDWTLDLLVERSISQISASRQEIREVGHSHVHDVNPAAAEVKPAPAEMRVVGEEPARVGASVVPRTV